MPDDFQYDVFLSHSAKDKAVVCRLAERLRKDGVKMWFDEWVLRPAVPLAHRMGEGSGVRAAKIEEGLERSRVLSLAHRMGEGGRRPDEGCMSASAFGSDWAQLEAGTFRFRDPLNNDRRFLQLRLDNAPVKGSGHKSASLGSPTTSAPVGKPKNQPANVCSHSTPTTQTYGTTI